MSDLASWLLEQIAEDERIARAAMPGRWAIHVGEMETEVLCALNERATEPADPMSGNWGSVCAWDHDELAQCQLRPDDLQPTASHIATWDPQHVLAECAAKRVIVRFCDPAGAPDGEGRFVAEHVLQILALPYADRAGYREEWRP